MVDERRLLHLLTNTIFLLTHQDKVRLLAPLPGCLRYAEKWKIDPHRIAAMGFSAGSHLLTTLLNRPEDGDVSTARGLKGITNFGGNHCPYMPDTPCGAAILLIPGGSYGGICPGQGEHFARWLNEQGIAAFVLRYRLGSAGYRYPSQHQDAVAPTAFFRNRRRQSPNTHLSQFP